MFSAKKRFGRIVFGRKLFSSKKMFGRIFFRQKTFAAEKIFRRKFRCPCRQTRKQWGGLGVGVGAPPGPLDVGTEVFELVTDHYLFKNCLCQDSLQLFPIPANENPLNQRTPSCRAWTDKYKALDVAAKNGTTLSQTGDVRRMFDRRTFV